MVKLDSLVLFLASAAVSPAAAQFVHPTRRSKAAIGGVTNDRDLAEGDFLQFDPPIAMDAYLSDTCLGDTEAIPSKVASIRVLADGEFCVGSILVGDDGTETMAYDLLDEITCTPWGVYDRYSTCDDATCSECEPATVSYYTWDDALGESLRGTCFFSSYSFDPSSFTNLQDVSFKFTDDANLADANMYLSTIGENSCIANGPGAVEDTEEDEEYDPEVEDEECLPLPDLVCAQEGFSILCEFLKEDPDIYAAASTDEFTLFAPSDDAISDIAQLFSSLDDDDTYRVLMFHVTPGILKSTDLACTSPSTLIEMVEGGSSRLVCNKDGDFVLKGGGNRKNNLLPVITDTDIMACNGVMHVVSEVMLPNFIDEF